MSCRRLRSAALGVGLSSLSSLVAVASGCGSATSNVDPPLPDASTGTGAQVDGGSGAACTAGQVECGGTCVDTQKDSRNCGACAKACDSGEICSAGTCGLSCKAPLTRCEGADGGGAEPFCANTQTDAANCGACGNACPSNHECTSGTCVDQCPAVPPDPSFTVAPASPMASESVAFDAPVTGVTYAWTFPGGTPATSTAQSPTVTWAAAGTYAVKLAITQGKCVQTKTTSVVVAPCTGTETFEYTGAEQSFVVRCATAIDVDAYGAAGGLGKRDNGGDAPGGLGGRARARVPVTRGETLLVYVGGEGASVGTGAAPLGGSGGFNGGGGVLDHTNPNPPGQTQGISGSGGGASDVRRGAALAGRLVVAGGGGGGGWFGQGAAGGGETGVDGNSSDASFPPGKGGTQTAGGEVGWTQGVYVNTAGSLGVGGTAFRDGAGNGGGGGGYYGGGAGGFCGGAGGSGFVAAAGNTSTSMETGVRAGNGRVVITW